jgi:hypothetical protein
LWGTSLDGREALGQLKTVAKIWNVLACEFSSRFQNCNKPMPFNRRYATISGFLPGVTYKQNTEDVVERFMVSIDHIAFLGQPGYQGNPTTIPRASRSELVELEVEEVDRVPKL